MEGGPSILQDLPKGHSHDGAVKPAVGTRAVADAELTITHLI